MSQLSRITLSTAAAVLLSLGSFAVPTLAQAQPVIQVQIHQAPPPPRFERAPKPRPGHVWAPGHWELKKGRHVWVAGSWVKARPGYTYHAPQWREHRGQWEYHAARWERDPRSKPRPPHANPGVHPHGRDHHTGPRGPQRHDNRHDDRHDNRPGHPHRP